MVRFTHDSGHTERGAERLYYNGSEYFASTVILISFDGFRPDYLNRGVTPNLKDFGSYFIYHLIPQLYILISFNSIIANEGIMASYMHPAFPVSYKKRHKVL